MAGRVQDKVALVTGAANAIGKNTSETLADEGAKVTGADSAEIASTSIFSLTLNLDVTKAEEWERAVAEIVQKYGRLDILINNAGMPAPLQPI